MTSGPGATGLSSAWQLTSSCRTCPGRALPLPATGSRESTATRLWPGLSQPCWRSGTSTGRQSAWQPTMPWSSTRLMPGRARLTAGLSVRWRLLMIKAKCFVYIFHFHFMVVQSQKVDFLQSRLCNQNWVAIVRSQINRTVANQSHVAINP